MLTIVALTFSGLLAGEELVVRWGVAPAISTLPDPAHLRARIALVRRLRVLVPMLIVPTLISVVIVVTTQLGRPAGWTALGLLAVFVAASAFGTIPINTQVIDWDPDAPPDRWRAVVRRWEQIDVLRSSTAVLSFIALLIASNPG